MTSMPALDLAVPIPCETPSEQASPRQAGGKAGNLLRLRELGYPVPRFVILPCVAFGGVLGDGRRETAVLAGSMRSTRKQPPGGRTVAAILEERPGRR